jgi:hypothetical protein
MGTLPAHGAGRIEDPAKGLRLGEIVKFFRSSLLVEGKTGTRERPENLDTFDRIDAKIGFQVVIQVKHLGGVPRPVAHNPDQLISS